MILPLEYVFETASTRAELVLASWCPLYLGTNKQGHLQQRQKQQEQRLTPCHTLLDRPTGKASFDLDEAREKTCPDLS